MNPNVSEVERDKLVNLLVPNYKFFLEKSNKRSKINRIIRRKTRSVNKREFIKQLSINDFENMVFSKHNKAFKKCLNWLIECGSSLVACSNNSNSEPMITASEPIHSNNEASAPVKINSSDSNSVNQAASMPTSSSAK